MLAQSLKRESSAASGPRAVNAPRPREQAGPPSPPDRLPPRRGGGPSASTYAVTAAGRPGGPARLAGARRGLVRSARMLAAAGLLALSGALALPAQAQTLPTLSVADAAAVTEGNDVTFTVTLSPASIQEVMVSWSASTVSSRGDTATKGSDYMGEEQTLTFAPAEMSKIVTVTTIDDALDEEDVETFTLTLLVPINAMLEGAAQFSQATGTINDNDPLPSVTVDNAMADEGGIAAFTVTLSAVSGRDVTVDYATANGSAAAGSDYTAANGMLTIAAGVPTGTVEVTTLTDDDSSESEETFTVTLSNPSNATLGTNFTGTGRIRNLAPPATPTGLMATAGNRSVALAWSAPASDADITHHEYRYKTTGSYPDTWKRIPYSAPGGFNEDGFTVTKLDNDTAHTFQLRAVNADGESAAVESSAVTPTGSGRIVESIELRRYDNQDGEPYGVGDEIVFVVKFSHGVNCMANAPNHRVSFNLGDATKNAPNYAGSFGSKSHWYRYTVQEGDVDSDGIEIPAGPEALPDQYYATSGCGDAFAENGIRAQGPFPDRKVDGVYPSLDSCTDRGHGLHLFGDMVNTLPCMASPQKEERHALERGVDHVSTPRIHAISSAAWNLAPRPLSPVRDQSPDRL